MLVCAQNWRHMLLSTPNVSSVIRGVLFDRSGEAEVEALVRRAVGSRALLVRALRRQCKPRAPTEGLSSVGSSTILLAIRVEPVIALRALDVGPAADDAAAAKAFQEFWGQKAELRRFPVRCQIPSASLSVRNVLR